MADAQTLNCPMCGAPASSDATQCEHCGARLATVACPSCFGLMFAGSKFCSHCGARADRTEEPEATLRRCPRCRIKLDAVLIGNTNLLECSHCEGIWADAATLQQICNDREKQAAVLGMPSPLPGADPGVEEKVSYVPCPVCQKLMNRVNFAHCSHVVVDVCSQHGTWFDKDELRKIVEFIRAGGLEKARADEIADLEDQRRRLESARNAALGNGPSYSRGSNYADWNLGISAAADFLKFIVK